MWLSPLTSFLAMLLTHPMDPPIHPSNNREHLFIRLLVQFILFSSMCQKPLKCPWITCEKGFILEWQKSFRSRGGRCTTCVLNSTELFTLKWLTLWYKNFTWINYSFKCKWCPFRGDVPSFPSVDTPHIYRGVDRTFLNIFKQKVRGAKEWERRMGIRDALLSISSLKWRKIKDSELGPLCV